MSNKFDPTYQDFQNRYKKLIGSLNPAQKKAVKTIEGPVLALAGPGTGKTHMLGARIARILKETDSQPNHILCLTFTESGVRAMKERMERFIGPEAQQLHIFTFHSFCHKIIKENSAELDHATQNLADELDKIDIIRELLLALDFLHPLIIGNRNQPFLYEGKLRHLFQYIKSQKKDPKTFIAELQEYADSLYSDERFIYKQNRGDIKKGDFKTKEIDKELKKVSLLISAIELYPLFDQKMREGGLYDFDDMILWALELISDPEKKEVLQRYQEQYLYILVDEFQDTNPAQYALLIALSNYWESPNLFIVGDDDQSIFGFQGARLENMMDFYRRFKKSGLHLIVLGENYRSSQPILDAAQTIVDKNQIRLLTQISSNIPGVQLEKKLFSVSENPQEINDAVQLFEATHLIDENTWLLQQIEKLLHNGTPPEEIAIIYAKHQQSIEIKSLLRKKQIPYSSKREYNILENEFILSWKLIAQYIVKEKYQPYAADDLIYPILRSKLWAVSPKTLGQLAYHLAKHNRYIIDLDAHKGLYWKDFLNDRPEIPLEDELSLSIYQLFIDQAMLSNTDDPVGFIDYFLENSPFRQVNTGEESDLHLGCFETLKLFAQDLKEKKGFLPLSQFIEYLDKMLDNQIPLPYIKNEGSSSGIQLMTAHASKGLEFSHVFLIHCIEKYWLESKNHLHQFSLLQHKTTDEEQEEKESLRRLFYVAMTRAKQVLYLSYHHSSSTGRENTVLSYIDEIRQRLTLPIQKITIESPKHTQVLQNTNYFIPPDFIEHFVLTASSINRFFECPLAFYYEVVLGIRSVAIQSDPLIGILFHKALEKLLKSKQTIEQVSQFLFHEALYLLEAYQTLLPDKEIQKIKTRLQTLIPAYSQQRFPADTWVPIEHSYAEKSMLSHFENMRLKGRFDQISLQPLHQGFRVSVKDYKYAFPQDEKLKKASLKSPGGSHFRQLAFYKLLIETHHKFTRVDDLKIDYLYPDNKGIFREARLSISDKEFEWFTIHLRNAYHTIQNNKIEKGCGKKTCRWCQLKNE